jgi:transcriptional regulator GlxA family with amidase domain
MVKFGWHLPMHHIAIVVYPGFELLDATGPASVFNAANRALVQRGAAPFYKVALVSAECGAVESSSGVALETRAIAATVRRRSQDKSLKVRATARRRDVGRPEAVRSKAARAEDCLATSHRSGPHGPLRQEQ